MTEQEYTPTEARLRERVKGSLGEYAHEFGIDGEAAMDEWIDQALAERDAKVRADERAKLQDRIEELEKNLSYEVEQKIKLADTLRDERAKRPDREQIDRIQFEIDNVHQIHGDTCLCGFKSSRSRSRTEHLTALFAEAVLALEPEASEEPKAAGNGFVSNSTPWWAEAETAPEAREEHRPSHVLNEYDDSTTRGLRRGEEVLRQLEHHWAADSATQAIEELLRLRRIVGAREVTDAEVEAAAKAIVLDTLRATRSAATFDEVAVGQMPGALREARAALEAAREVSHD